ncbi:hypothetical protein NCS57_01405100 [Fusarium keratoplasticum]|uniref:Uncharacterized protein n=1 Tax=Fusarium keratoplasticum TaxID=1328300 RepID=A0ACC0QDD5_9HYPO|nr:hypothetical protein NCS57_01405100 [Fusarium keratoplasticum]KAI8650706.1 hypothetical protein NCS57_01405100 [Fusarium keratoplasticum]KAI8651512.1 hypothetical protein NCS55_01396200 [Fusarium keratoplasticum]
MSSPKQASSPKSPSSPAKGAETGADHAPETTERSDNGPIEVDDDADSTYSGSTRVTDTESLRTSILNYKWENGRRYHAYNDGAYWGPNDERQQEAEDLMHEMYRIILDGNLYAAPLGENPQRVLDVGCGTGIWAIPSSEFADEHPSADVLGVDLSPIQPGFVPPNCKFEVDDINQEWTFPDNSFDFVHIRAMTGCIPDWVELHKKAFKALKPGGWVEHVELWGITKSDDGSLKDNSPLKKWVEVFEKIGALTGKGFFYGHKAADFQREAGFENLVERRLKMPLGPWPKDKRLKTWGAWNRQFLLQALEGFSIRGLTELLGWTYDDAQLFLVEMRNELLNPAVHSYGEVTIIYSQKPETTA